MYNWNATKINKINVGINLQLEDNAKLDETKTLLLLVEQLVSSRSEPIVIVRFN